MLSEICLFINTKNYKILYELKTDNPNITAENNS